MAMWSRNLSNQHQIFAEAIFNRSHIECEAVFWWLPHLSRWSGRFKTKFKYLSLIEDEPLEHDFIYEYDSFVQAIEAVKERVEREYNYYFNALWC